MKYTLPADYRAMMLIICRVFGKLQGEDDTGVYYETPYIGGLSVYYDRGGKCGSVTDKQEGKVLEVGGIYTAKRTGEWERRFKLLYTVALLHQAGVQRRIWAGMMYHKNEVFFQPVFGQILFPSDYRYSEDE